MLSSRYPLKNNSSEIGVMIQMLKNAKNMAMLDESQVVPMSVFVAGSPNNVMKIIE